MEYTPIIFEFSAWWIFPLVILAALLSFLMYRKSEMPWGKNTNNMLLVFRFVAITVILVLLLNPLINQLVRRTEKPQVVLAIDNSISVIKESDSVSLTNLIRDLENDLINDGYEVAKFGLEDLIPEQGIRFDEPKTDLSSQLRKIEAFHEGRNLGTVIMVSDGIYNRGSSPLNRNTLYPIYTIGAGDTIPPKDIGIIEVNSNQVAYQGNKFPVEVLINNFGYDGQRVNLTLRSRGNMLDQKTVTLSGNNIERFEVEATSPGLTRFSLEVSGFDDEEAVDNNHYDLYIDVVEGKEQILLVSPFPHPDMRAIRNALGQSENYETYLHIPGIHEFDQNLSYDVVIVLNAFTSFELPEIKGNPSYWYVLGQFSRLKALSAETGILITSKGNQRDNVKPALNPNFSKFQLDNDLTDFLRSYPTINIPFGEYTINGPVETLLYQQVGSIVTDKPLLSFFDNGSKRIAILMGSGIWKWSLQESALSDKSDNFKQIILKTIQYLSVRTDKRKFRFQPIDRIFVEGDPVRFTSESYNDIYERVSGNEILVVVRDESGNTSSFNFVANANNNILNAGSMSEGIYRYTASTRLGNEPYSAQGEFLVKKIQLENLTLTANHQLLRDLATKSGGKFYSTENGRQVVSDIVKEEFKSIIHTNQNYFPLINMMMILILLILLVSLEWGLRKYFGSY